MRRSKRNHPVPNLESNEIIESTAEPSMKYQSETKTVVSTTHEESATSPSRTKRSSPLEDDADDEEFWTVQGNRKKSTRNKIKRVLSTANVNENARNSLGSTTASGEKMKNTSANSSPYILSPTGNRATTETAECQQTPITINTVQHDGANGTRSTAVTEASTRYALTRFPLPPWSVKFMEKNIDCANLKRDMEQHFRTSSKATTNIICCRRSSAKLNDPNEVLVLVFPEDTETFVQLLDSSLWPSKLMGLEYSIHQIPSIPPQLSLIAKNVDLRIDLDDFSNEVISQYPDVVKISRMKNKYGENTTLVKLELNSAKTRTQLIETKRLKVNHICYDVTEFLAPVNVLICSKCCGLGHFRKQCPENLETCRTCSAAYTLESGHICSGIHRCKHCNGDHKSNSMQCLVIKSFRADLTRRLLGNQNQQNWKSFGGSTATPAVLIRHENGAWKTGDKNSHQRWGHGPESLASKIDNLIQGISKINASLNNLVETNKRFDDFMASKTVHDQHIENEVISIKDQTKKTETKTDLLIERTNAAEIELQRVSLQTSRLILPCIEDILACLLKNASSRTIDTESKNRLSRYRNLVVNAMEGKPFC